VIKIIAVYIIVIGSIFIFWAPSESAKLSFVPQAFKHTRLKVYLLLPFAASEPGFSLQVLAASRALQLWAFRYFR
jgi:hypothetical protein